MLPFDSRDIAEQKLQWLLSPMPVEEFFRDYFEQKPLLIERTDTEYYSGIYGLADIVRLVDRCDPNAKGINMLLEDPREFDITSYKDGKRRTWNENSLLAAEDVWKMVKQDGCSLRVLRPQKCGDSLWALLSKLEQAFGSGCGANIYLTPPGTQGFAPHWDDVDVFILQVSGTKKWKLHENPSNPELKVHLPSTSSPDLEQDAVGEPTLTVDLKPGCLLYLPRGTIHQAKTIGSVDSLHITISTAYRNSVADYLKLCFEGAIESAIEETKALRMSMPREYTDFLGVVHEDSQDPETISRRLRFCSSMQSIIHSIVERMPLDAAADQMAKRFLATRLPPVLDTKPTLETSSEFPLNEGSLVRLVRADCVRLCVEEDAAVLYHCLENDRGVHCNEDLAALEYELDFAAALECLIVSYPNPVVVSSLPELASTESLDLVKQLREDGLLEVCQEDMKMAA